MKQRLIILLCTLLTFTGCIANTPDAGKADTGVVEWWPSDEEVADSEMSDSEGSEADEGESREADASPEPEAKKKTAGGYPWLDTTLKENVTDQMEVSAQDDFYLYVNYEWLRDTQLPEGAAIWNNSSKTEEEIAEKGLAMMTDDSIVGHDADLIRTAYQTMTDWNARNDVGTVPMQKTVEEIRKIGNLEEMSDFICDPERCYRVPVFVSFENIFRRDDTSKYALVAKAKDADFILMSASEYKLRTQLGERIYSASMEYSKEMLVRIGYTEEDAKKLFEDAIELEGLLAKGLDDQWESRYSAFDAEEQKNDVTKDFPLTRMIKAYGFGAASECGGQKPYLQNLGKLYTEDHLELIKAYMIVGFVMHVAPALDQKGDEAYVRYVNRITGRSGSEPYEKRAFESLKSTMSVPMTKMYITKYHMAPVKERIEKLIGQVIDEYKEMIREEEWLSEETKNKAIKKLDHMIVNAVYPDQMMDYSSMELNGLSNWEVGRTVRRFDHDIEVSHVNGIVDKHEWNIQPLEANACYSREYNSITIPIGVLGGDYYYDGMTDEELYAGIGVIIGHEISHAFDSNGAESDEEGQMINWWTPEDKKAFEDKMKQLKKYYKGKTLWEGEPVSAERISNEMCADLAGMKVILRIAKKQKDFDSDRFFKAYATSRKELTTYEYQQFLNAKDNHPMAFLRVNSVLQQFEEFMDTYDIHEGDGMYLAPEDRVHVW